jgi:aspartate/tyrosine/aromatic aminotransferase
MSAAVLQMALMAGRIAGVRSELQAALEKRCPDKDWSFITQQIGMFSFTGMTPQQVGATGCGCWEMGIAALCISVGKK